MPAKMDQLQRAVIRSKGNDTETKYQVASMFKYIKKLIDYQVPTPPIDVSEDGHKFTCPRCGTKFESEDHVSAFYGCLVCLQRWKEEESEEEENAEE
ncbi:MAG: hypothetical protein IKZ08_02945 [Bacteroidales bacterium]|nr:hypothetical protein [Bacteroidales bacterium]